MRVHGLLANFESERLKLEVVGGTGLPSHRGRQLLLLVPGWGGGRGAAQASSPGGSYSAQFRDGNQAAGLLPTNFPLVLSSGFWLCGEFSHIPIRAGRIDLLD